MSEQENAGRTGRPVKYTEAHRKTTIELPQPLIDFLATVKPNRTRWVIVAIREKMEREAAIRRYLAEGEIEQAIAAYAIAIYAGSPLDFPAHLKDPEVQASLREELLGGQEL